MPDPNLKLAAEELKALCLKYDIAGSFALVSPTHGEFLYVLSASWSCITFEPGTAGSAFVRIKALAKDYPSKEAHKKALEDSIGMLAQLRTIAQRTDSQMTELLTVVGKHMDVMHVDRLETDEPPPGRG